MEHSDVVRLINTLNNINTNLKEISESLRGVSESKTKKTDKELMKERTDGDLDLI